MLRRYVIGYFPTRLELLFHLTLHLACLSLSAQLRAALDKNFAPRSLPLWSPLESSTPPPLVLPASCRRTRRGRLGPGDRPLCQPSRCSFRSGQRILQQHPGEVIETTLKNLWSGLGLSTHLNNHKLAAGMPFRGEPGKITSRGGFLCKGSIKKSKWKFLMAFAMKAGGSRMPFSIFFFVITI